MVKETLNALEALAGEDNSLVFSIVSRTTKVMETFKLSVRMSPMITCQ